jgi:hypothetical protein
MCKGISAIAVQRGERRLYFKSGVNSHEEIREAFNLSDNKIGEQVNLEAHLFGDFFNIKDWKIIIDHDVSDIPKWFEEDRPNIEGLFLDFLEEEIRETKATGTYKGSLNLGYLIDGNGIKLPKKIGGSLNLYSMTSAKGLVMPKKIGGSLYLESLTSAEGLVLPKEIGGNLYLHSMTSAKGLVMPNEIGGWLDLHSLTSAEGLVMPNEIGGWLDLRSMTSAEGLVLPKEIGGYLDLSGLTSAKGLVMPKEIGGYYWGPKV